METNNQTKLQVFTQNGLLVGRLQVDYINKKKKRINREAEIYKNTKTEAGKKPKLTNNVEKKTYRKMIKKGTSLQRYHVAVSFSQLGENMKRDIKK